MTVIRVSAIIKAIDQGGTSVQAGFCVDPSALDCVVPAPMLIKAGVEPEGTEIYELSGGQRVEYPVGFARIELMDTTAIAKVIFGPPDSDPVLGTIAMELAGLTVDLSTRTIRRLPVRSLKRQLGKFASAGP
jgi:hypothetical protein